MRVYWADGSLGFILIGLNRLFLCLCFLSLSELDDDDDDDRLFSDDLEPFIFDFFHFKNFLAKAVLYSTTPRIAKTTSVTTTPTIIPIIFLVKKLSVVTENTYRNFKI